MHKLVAKTLKVINTASPFVDLAFNKSNGGFELENIV